ncbi:TetR/AcrR family transcriptional regulator [Micromonospora sp. NPDC003197]
MDPQGDLTARARIRDVALKRFAADGIAATSVRRIALDARVSAGLVVHHFGSKQGLVDACDAYVLAFTKAAWREVDGDPTRLPHTLRASTSVLGYLTRSMVEQTAGSAALFDALVNETARVLALGEETGHIRRSTEPELRAALLVCMELGGLALRAHLARHLGADPFAPDGVVRIGQTGTELLTRGLFTEGSPTPSLHQFSPPPEVQ